MRDAVENPIDNEHRLGNPMDWTSEILSGVLLLSLICEGMLAVWFCFAVLGGKD